jgi:hypothetical protein
LAPAEVAVLARRGGRRDRLRDVFPGLAGLEVRQGVGGLRLRGGLLGRTRLAGVGVVIGRDLDDPGVPLLVDRRLFEQLGIDVGVRDRDPGLAGQAGLDHDVDEPLERQRTEAAPALLEELELAGDVRLAQPPLVAERPEPILRVGDPEALDREPVAKLVLGDRRAVHGCRGPEMVVVPRPAGVADEDEDRDRDGDGKAEVEEEGPPIAGVPAGAAGSTDDGPGTERHAVVVPCRWWGARADADARTGSVSYRSDQHAERSLTRSLSGFADAGPALQIR